MQRVFHGKKLTLENRTGYRTADLVRFVDAGLRACGVYKRMRVVFVSSPIRSRGCAEIGGDVMVIAIAAPNLFRMKRLARVFIHECAHIRGYEHEDMPERLRYSLGGTPAWAENLSIGYEGRAPRQLSYLYRARAPKATKARVTRTRPRK